MLCIILPTSWNQIIVPRLYDANLSQLRQIHRDRLTQSRNIFHNPPEEADPMNVEYITMQGDWFYRSTVWSFTETHEQRIRFQRYLYENYFPASKEVENAMDDINRKRIHIDNMRSIIFFFNPIVLFNDISMKIAGNSRSDYVRFLHAAREVRNELVDTGSRDGWLFGYGFSAMFSEEYMFGSIDDWMYKFETMDNNDLFDEIMGLMEAAQPFTFDKPNFRRFEQPNLSVLEIFTQIILVLGIFVMSILTLWIVIWVKFLKFDVR
jgi:hypothetical protein